MTADCVIQRWKMVWNTTVVRQKRLDLDLRGGGVQVGQPHVRRLRRGQLIHGRNEAVHVFVYVVQEAEHADVGVDAHGELRLGVPVVLGAVLFLLREKEDVNNIRCSLGAAPLASSYQQGGSVLVARGYESSLCSPITHSITGY